MIPDIVFTKTICEMLIPAHLGMIEHTPSCYSAAIVDDVPLNDVVVLLVTSTFRWIQRVDPIR